MTTITLVKNDGQWLWTIEGGTSGLHDTPWDALDDALTNDDESITDFSFINIEGTGVEIVWHDAFEASSWGWINPRMFDTGYDTPGEALKAAIEAGYVSTDDDIQLAVSEVDSVT